MVVSFGGWSGKKLGSSCKTPAALAAAYQKVIDAYSLQAIDIDIEHGEFTNRKTRKRVVEALALVQQREPRAGDLDHVRARPKRAPRRTVGA